MIKWGLSQGARIFQYLQISVIYHFNKLKNKYYICRKVSDETSIYDLKLPNGHRENLS